MGNKRGILIGIVYKISELKYEHFLRNRINPINYLHKYSSKINDKYTHNF